MKAQRKGSNILIEKRLAAYDAAVKSGKSSDEAMQIAKAITRKDIGRVRA